MLKLEPGGKKRKCCNAPYCDHCYVRDNKVTIHYKQSIKYKSMYIYGCCVYVSITVSQL